MGFLSLKLLIIEVDVYVDGLGFQFSSLYFFFIYFLIILEFLESRGICALKAMSCSICLKRELVLFHFSPKRKFNHIGVSKQQNLSKRFCSQ